MLNKRTLFKISISVLFCMQLILMPEQASNECRSVKIESFIPQKIMFDSEIKNVIIGGNYHREITNKDCSGEDTDKGRIYLIDVIEWSVRKIELDGYLSDIKFRTNDNTFLISDEHNSYIKLIDVETSSVLWSHKLPISSYIIYDSIGLNEYLLLTKATGRIYFLDITQKEVFSRYANCGVNLLGISGQYGYLGGWSSNNLYIIDLPLKIIRNKINIEMNVDGLHVMPNDRYIMLTNSYKNEFKIFDTSALTISTVSLPILPLAISFTPDKNTLLISDYFKLYFYNLNTHNIENYIDGCYEYIAFTKDSQFAFAAPHLIWNQPMPLSVINLATYEVKIIDPDEKGLIRLETSPDGIFIVGSKSCKLNYNNTFSDCVILIDVQTQTITKKITLPN